MPTPGATGAAAVAATGKGLTLSRTLDTDGTLALESDALMPGCKPGRAAATASRISLPAPGTTSAIASATALYWFGTALQTAVTMFAAFSGAADAAARAIVIACFGCASAATAAALAAMSGTDLEIAATTLLRLAGLSEAAACTTCTVSLPRSLGFAVLTNAAARAGRSAAGVRERLSLAATALTSAPKPAETEAKAANSVTRLTTALILETRERTD